MLLLYGVNSSLTLLSFSSTKEPLYLHPVYFNFKYPLSLYLLAWQPKVHNIHRVRGGTCIS